MSLIMKPPYRVIKSWDALDRIGQLSRRSSTPNPLKKTQSRKPVLHIRSLPFSSSVGDDSSNHAFDRHFKLLQRESVVRVHNAWYGEGKPQPGEAIDYDYFRHEIATRLVDRLDDIKRDDGFPLALDIGSGSGYIYKAICADAAFDGVGGIGGVRKLVQLDSSEMMLFRDGSEQVDGSHRCGTYRLTADEEGTLPFPDWTFDLVMTSVALHWVNDLPLLFSEVNRILKPDGCFMCAMVGGSTLPELRASLVLAEMERDGGVSPHVGPFVEMSDVGGLLSGAGFSLPTVDVDTLKIGYPNAMVLMEHLQRMGEGNACINRRERTGVDTFIAASCLYDQMFGLETDEGIEEDNVEASVQVIYAIGWSPHESQQQPLQRGSATLKVGDMVTQHSTKEEEPNR